MLGLFVRRCQECGHKQESKPPSEYKSDAWKDTKCRKCGSSGLDYGSWGWERNGKELQRLPMDVQD